MEMFIMIDALRRASAARDYRRCSRFIGLRRQDRKDPPARSHHRQANRQLSWWRAGANRILTIDLARAQQIQGFF
jgi:phosphoribosylpyrophosphate synthetase